MTTFHETVSDAQCRFCPFRYTAISMSAVRSAGEKHETLVHPERFYSVQTSLRPVIVDAAVGTEVRTIERAAIGAVARMPWSSRSDVERVCLGENANAKCARLS